MSEIIPLFVEAILIEKKKIFNKNKKSLNPIPYSSTFKDKVMRRFAWFWIKMTPGLKSIKFALNKDTNKIDISLVCAKEILMAPYNDVFDEFLRSAYFQQLMKTGEFTLNIGK